MDPLAVPVAARPSSQAGPGRFPNPVVNTSCIFSSDVEADDGTMELKNILCSASGLYYGFSIVIKKSIYGLVVRAKVLQPTMNETYRRTGQEVAIKVCAKDVLMRNNNVSLENPITEIAAMQDIGEPRHPNLAHQYECCVDDKNIYSILKFQPGVELFDHILNCGPLSELSARCMFQQLMLALFRLQQRDISHRDISLENIMFNAQDHGTVLIDFGLCVKLQRDPLSGAIVEIPNAACGKGYYMSPESAWDGRSQLVNPLQGDVWSAGMCLLYALLGFPPIERAVDDDIRYNYLTQGRLNELLDHWEVRLSAEVVDLIQLILRPDPADRPSVQQIWHHSWMQAEGLPSPFASEITAAERAALCGYNTSSADKHPAAGTLSPLKQPPSTTTADEKEGWGSSSMDTSGGADQITAEAEFNEAEDQGAMDHDDCTTREGEGEFSYRSSVESRWSAVNTPTAAHTYGNAFSNGFNSNVNSNNGGLPPLSNSKSGEGSPPYNAAMHYRQDQQQQHHLQQAELTNRDSTSSIDTHCIHSSSGAGTGTGRHSFGGSSPGSSSSFSSSSSSNSSHNNNSQNGIGSPHQQHQQHQQLNGGGVKSPNSTFTGYHTRSHSFGKSPVNYAV